MAPTPAAHPVEFAPKRATIPPVAATLVVQPKVQSLSGPYRIEGRAGDGLYWSLRDAGASPDVAAQYLAALATRIDVGEVGPTDSFVLVLGADHQLLYSGLERVGSPSLELVKWTANGHSNWIDPQNAEQPARSTSGFIMPAAGPVTSYFGYRFHPILHFTRFHAGIDIGASFGSPIVAAADGEVAAAGWAGGYGREVQIAHGSGVVSLYGHMSQIAVSPGNYVHAGQIIGYVGSSGLSTGPHVHFEVRVGGTPVNPLGVRLSSTSVVDTHLADALKARLRLLLSVGTRKSISASSA